MTPPVEDMNNLALEGAGLRRGSNGHMPSRAFKYLQDQYDAQQGPVNRTAGINNREDLAEIYNKRNRFFVFLSFFFKDLIFWININ